MLKNYTDIYYFFIEKRLAQMWSFLSFAFLLALLGAPIPYLFGYLIDVVIPSKDTELLVKIIFSMAFLMLTSLLIQYFNSALTFKVRKEITVDTIDSMLDGIFNMPYEQRTALHTGELISRLTRDINQLHYILPFGIANLVYRFLFSLIMIGILVFLNWKLSVMLLLLLPFVFIIYLTFNKSLWEYAFKDADASANNIKYLSEVISADFEIKSYGAHKKFKQLAMKAVKSFQQIHFQRLLINQKMNTNVSLLPIFSTIIVWYYASLMVIDSEITIGLIITYTTTIGLIIPSIMQIVGHISEYPNQIAVFRRIQQFATPNEKDSNGDYFTKSTDVKLKPPIQNLHIRNINFSYQGHNKPIFDNFSYRFKKGKIYLIKAPNGYGKSTLFSLISKNLSPSSGQILLDTTPLSNIKDLHKHITLLPQQVNIISDSIRNNLSFGDDSISENEILNILEQLGLKEWVQNIDSGLDHILTTSKQQLSGGQIQRIGLARAFLRKSSILLLDEPTNNLDNTAVNHLINSIKCLRKDTICLIISHDDRIYPHVDETLNLSY